MAPLVRLVNSLLLSAGPAAIVYKKYIGEDAGDVFLSCAVAWFLSQTVQMLMVKWCIGMEPPEFDWGYEAAATAVRVVDFVAISILFELKRVRQAGPMPMIVGVGLMWSLADAFFTKLPLLSAQTGMAYGFLTLVSAFNLNVSLLFESAFASAVLSWVMGKKSAAVLPAFLVALRCCAPSCAMFLGSFLELSYFETIAAYSVFVAVYAVVCFLPLARAGHVKVL
ncbi:hypothetical protein DIPPA_21513 [Diplonema papillatum]|nr:hypothetical protein DIPPA_21513 [Diplonema papillatum]